MASLENILNIAIPWGVILIFVGLIYWKLKEPMDLVGKGIWKVLSAGFEALGSSLSGSSVTEVTYK